MSAAGSRLGALGQLEIEVAFRAALAAAVPLSILIAIGRPELAPYAAFGGMAAIYGRGERYRVRARTVSTAAVMLVAAIAAGTAIAATGASLAVEALALLLLLVGGILVVNVARLGPPTTIFPTFALLVCASAPTPPEEVGLRILVGAVSAAFALALSLSGWMLRRFGGARVARLLKTLPKEPAVRVEAVRDPAVWLNIVEVVVGAAAAGAIALAFGIGHPYWAVVTLVAVVPPAGAAHSTSRSVHRVLGTLGGVVITGLVLWADPPIQVLVVVIAIGQFGAEVLVGRHYGAALLCITPLALVVAHIAHPQPLGLLLADRVLETVIGSAVGLVVVLAARALAARRSSVE
ncbi:FUSC family protein [Agromyces archimandritae]|uniref:FUSC family protein n=1 Tax=Agromyces archimandritae TaxID=2781962 RepID=A0A975IMU9_9MICO|nr:FUSC family protein [Agromyces archimandritae]QTX03908.1 FUSC family protein [Agromyces archimandritae]